MTKREKLIRNAQAAFNEIEEFLDTIRPENRPSFEAIYEFEAEQAELLQDTAEEALEVLKRLKRRI